MLHALRRPPRQKLPGPTAFDPLPPGPTDAPSLLRPLLLRAKPYGLVPNRPPALSPRDPDRACLVAALRDVLASVHGSQNANVMWMRPGAAFMELNPYKFFYSSYEELATVSRVRYLPSRRNSIASPAMTAAETLTPATSSALATVNRLRSCLPGCCAR